MSGKQFGTFELLLCSPLTAHHLLKMLLARVIGNVVATQKNQRYEGTRAMLCRQITPTGEDMDYTCIALDSVNSGEGDIVIIAQEGWSASTAATGKAGAAIDSAIVGVVDYIDLLPKEEVSPLNTRKARKPD